MASPEPDLSAMPKWRAEKLADADAAFDCVMGELRAMRDRFVEAGDYGSLMSLAQNLEGETW